MISKLLEEQVAKSGNYGRYQFYLLLTGAGFYVAWHIIEMYGRTVAVGFIQ
ncbi:MAG: hypothetical protein K2Z80_02810 [Xanthobacteraceae bacterium]|nr:hypothetical protein [Xanthobacteraceae bacterium]MBX9840720.1 hypothetical protein [Xanthobacteraceae bacterium]